MNDYYKILGVTPEASEVEIKRAYFRLIRKYSPESDPEKFQEIRHAYEQLKDGGEKLKEDENLSKISDPFAKKMYEQCKELAMRGDMEESRDTAEEAWRLFPGEPVFLFMLVRAQRLCGNTGKAVKNAEKLVKYGPDNKALWKELALSYLERGYTKKAYPAFEKAYEMGMRDMDFILLFGKNCMQCEAYERGAELAEDIILQEKKWSKDEIPDLIEVYLMCFNFYQFSSSPGRLSECLDVLLELIKGYRLQIRESVTNLASGLVFYGVVDVEEPKINEKVRQVLEALEKICPGETERQELRQLIEEALMSRIADDERISETLKRGVEAFYYADYEERILEFAQLDIKLCMIKERDEILAQTEILQKDYPMYYEKIKDFIRVLQSGEGLDYLKEKLKKKYDRFENFISGGYYYELYPEEKGTKGGMVTDSEFGTPYVRAGKKIGRNDPCPCGSGKKYKQCCMQKSAK